LTARDWRLKCSLLYGSKTFQEGYSVAKERNNIYAITADAVDLALDTAGAIGSMVGGVANAVGLGPGKDKSESDEQDRRDANDAADRVSNSLRQEAEAVKPRSQSSKSNKTQSSSSHKAQSGSSHKAQSGSSHKAQSGSSHKAQSGSSHKTQASKSHKTGATKHASASGKGASTKRAGTAKATNKRKTARKVA
jgi:hypothetical protein